MVKVIKMVKMVKVIKMVRRLIRMVMVIFKLTSPDLTNPLIHSFDEVDTSTRGAVFPGVTRVLTKKYSFSQILSKKVKYIKKRPKYPVST